MNSLTRSLMRSLKRPMRSLKMKGGSKPCTLASSKVRSQRQHVSTSVCVVTAIRGRCVMDHSQYEDSSTSSPFRLMWKLSCLRSSVLHTAMQKTGQDPRILETVTLQLHQVISTAQAIVEEKEMDYRRSTFECERGGNAMFLINAYRW